MYFIFLQREFKDSSYDNKSSFSKQLMKQNKRDDNVIVDFQIKVYIYQHHPQVYQAEWLLLLDMVSLAGAAPVWICIDR